MAVDASSPTSDWGKAITKDGDESCSDVDFDNMRMIDEGLTQLDERLERGSRTITIPIDRDLLVNTEEVVPALDPLYSDVEGKILKEINDSASQKVLSPLLSG